jgi:hypothetical protein
MCKENVNLIHHQYEIDSEFREILNKLGAPVITFYYALSPKKWVYLK